MEKICIAFGSNGFFKETQTFQDVGLSLLGHLSTFPRCKSFLRCLMLNTRPVYTEGVVNK